MDERGASSLVVEMLIQKTDETGVHTEWEERQLEMGESLKGPNRVPQYVLPGVYCQHIMKVSLNHTYQYRVCVPRKSRKTQTSRDKSIPSREVRGRHALIR